MSPMREVDELKALRLRLCQKICARDPAEAICRDPVKCPNIVRAAPADTASHMPPSQPSTAVTGTGSTFAERALSLNALFCLPLLVLLLYAYYVLAGRIEKRQPGAQVKYADKAEEDGSVPAPEAEAPDTAENDKPAAKDMASDVERSAAAEAVTNDEREAEVDMVDEIEREIGEEHAVPASHQPAEHPASDVERSAAAEVVANDETEADNEVDMVDEIEQEIGEEHAARASIQPAEDPASDVERSAAAEAVANDEREADNEVDMVDEIEREVGEEHAARESPQPADDPASDVERSAAAEAVANDEREADNEVDMVDEIEREIGEEHAAPASPQSAEDPASDVEQSAAAEAVANNDKEADNEMDMVDEIEREIGEEGRRHMIKGPAAARLLAGMAVEYTEDANEADAANAANANYPAEAQSETETVGEIEREAGENETLAAKATRGASSEEKVDSISDVPMKSIDDTLTDEGREIMAANALRSISPADAVAAATEDVSSTATAS